MQNESTTISNQVLSFYKELPFNLYGSDDTAANSLLRANQIKIAYPDLDRILASGHVNSLLDLGCGAGWLANTVAHYYSCLVSALDFNSVAVSAAKRVSEKLNTQVDFHVGDLFTFNPNNKFDLVTSIGVLHHTGDVWGGIKTLTKHLSFNPQARIYFGLYHYYGRKPFLEIFSELKSKGASEQDLFTEYKQLHSSLVDETHLRSWFRDQVLHPHETQHTLEEVKNYLETLDFEIESTSINGFNRIQNIHDLYTLEKDLMQLSYKRNVTEKKYYPGFFTVCAKRR